MAFSEGNIKSITEPGIRAEGELLQTMRREVANLLGRSQLGFPGAQPVSFLRRHLTELMSKDYFVCEKSDGIRYLLYCTENEAGQEAHYLIDRRNDYWYVNNRNLHFPLGTDIQRFHTRTILDGEMVMDDLGEGRVLPKFLVFDCIVLDGELLIEKTLDKRIGRLQTFLLHPYKDLFQQFPNEVQFQPFIVELKDLQTSYGVEMIFREIMPNLRHGNDGLVFTCRSTPYRFNTDPNILKWKPADENTIDCRLRLIFPPLDPDLDDADATTATTTATLDYDAMPRAELWIFCGDREPQSYQRLDDAFIDGDEWEALRGLDEPLIDRVVECYKDDRGRWRLLRFRDDKPEANHIKVVHSIMESIDDHVTEKDLLDAAKAIKDNWKLRQQKNPPDGVAR